MYDDDDYTPQFPDGITALYIMGFVLIVICMGMLWL